jgi:hypothetical protein
MPEMRAAFMVASLGGKTRFSTNMDSTAVVGVVTDKSPLVKQSSPDNVTAGTYKPLTVTGLTSCSSKITPTPL